LLFENLLEPPELSELLEAAGPVKNTATNQHNIKKLSKLIILDMMSKQRELT